MSCMLLRYFLRKEDNLWRLKANASAAPPKQSHAAVSVLVRSNKVAPCGRHVAAKEIKMAGHEQAPHAENTLQAVWTAYWSTEAPSFLQNAR